MSRPRGRWFFFWMAWLGTFVVAETIAIVNPDRGDTLSESIWFLQRSWWPLTVILAVLFLFLIFHFLVDRRSRKETTMPKPTHLVVQATKQPIRKVRFGTLAALALTLITYVVSASQGEAIISNEAAIDALTALGAAAVPLVTAWFTKSAVTEAGE